MREKLTKGDVEKIKAELDHRKVVLRWEIARTIAEAAAQGDRSENFEYYAAKRNKGQNESRIRYLERLLRTAEIVSDDSAEDEVGLNNIVHVYDYDECEEIDYRIVTAIRANVLDNQIALNSPVAKALMHRKVGDVVTVKVDDDYSYKIKICSIDKTNDESSDRISSY